VTHSSYLPNWYLRICHPFPAKRKSNFAGFYGSKAFLVRNNGVDMKLYFDESLNAVVFASEFPENIKAIRYLKHSTGKKATTSKIL